MLTPISEFGGQNRRFVMIFRCRNSSFWSMSMGRRAPGRMHLPLNFYTSGRPPTGCWSKIPLLIHHHRPVFTQMLHILGARLGGCMVTRVGGAVSVYGVWYRAVISSCRVASCRPSLSACARASLFFRRFSPPGPICATPPTVFQRPHRTGPTWDILRYCLRVLLTAIYYLRPVKD